MNENVTSNELLKIGENVLSLIEQLKEKRQKETLSSISKVLAFVVCFLFFSVFDSNRLFRSFVFSWWHADFHQIAHNLSMRSHMRNRFNVRNAKFHLSKTKIIYIFLFTFRCLFLRRFSNFKKKTKTQMNQSHFISTNNWEKKNT